MSEAEILRACILRLSALPGVRVFRMNTGTAVNRQTGQFVKFGAPGMPDMLVLVHDRYAWLECKAPAGRVSEAQRNFLGMVQALGGTCGVVRSAAEAAAIIEPLLQRGTP